MSAGFHKKPQKPPSPMRNGMVRGWLMRLGMSSMSVLGPMLARGKGIAIVAIVLLLGLGTATGVIPQAMRAIRADVDAWALNAQAEANDAKLREQAARAQADMVDLLVNTPASAYKKKE